MLNITLFLLLLVLFFLLGAGSAEEEKSFSKKRRASFRREEKAKINMVEEEKNIVEEEQQEYSSPEIEGKSKPQVVREGIQMKDLEKDDANENLMKELIRENQKGKSKKYSVLT